MRKKIDSVHVEVIIDSQMTFFKFTLITHHATNRRVYVLLREGNSETYVLFTE